MIFCYTNGSVPCPVVTRESSSGYRREQVQRPTARHYSERPSLNWRFLPDLSSRDLWDAFIMKIHKAPRKSSLEMSPTVSVVWHFEWPPLMCQCLRSSWGPGAGQPSRLSHTFFLSKDTTLLAQNLSLNHPRNVGLV